MARRCIVTVVSPGYEGLLDDLLGSLRANGGCEDALVVVFAVDLDAACARVIARHGAALVRCRPLGRMNQTIKAVLYSVARVVRARQYLCLDADTLILGDLGPVLGALDAYPEESILVCRDAYLGHGTLQQHLRTHYAGGPRDLELLLGTPADEGNYALAVNDGVFAGSRAALLGLDGVIRGMTHAATWVDQYPDHGWRNQLVFNLALARLCCGVELDPTYNLQVHVHDLQLAAEEGRPRALWRGRPVRVAHFCGWGRDRYPELRARAARPQADVSRPRACPAPAGPNAGDA